MNRTIGVESWNAVCTPMEALVAPGPRVTKQMPGPAGELAVRLGHEGRSAFLPVDDEADAVAQGMEAVEHGQKAFARHAEGDASTPCSTRHSTMRWPAGCAEVMARGSELQKKEAQFIDRLQAE